MEETLFYVFGIALVLSALVLSALGLRSESFPTSRILLAGMVAYFVVLVGATSTFAVLNAREEQRKHERRAGGGRRRGGQRGGGGGWRHRRQPSPHRRPSLPPRLGASAPSR